MAEKILNARLRLKIDTYENWIINNPVLLAGEVAFATISVAQEGTVNTVPSILAKVGDGIHTFSELGWLYSRASDVASWAKAANPPTVNATDVVGMSEFISNYVEETLGVTVDTNDVFRIAKVDDYNYKLQTKAKTDADTAWVDVEGSAFIIPNDTAAITALQDTLDTKAAASDVTALSGKVTTLIGTDTGKSVRTIANEELAAQLIPDTAKESLDTLQEIADWIQKHPDDASAMSTAIDALEEKVGDSTVSAQITAAINELKAGDIKSATNRISALEADSHTHANKALLDTYTQTEADLADAVAKKHEHANAAELAKFVDGDKAKLDTAVQSVTAGTGLTATKTGTDVAIGIDDSITFIFDCGNASV